MDKLLKTAVVGAGYFAQFHIEAWKRLDHAQLGAIVEIDPQHRQQLAAQHPGVEVISSISELSFRPDIIDIATPPVTHAEQIEQAFTHEKALVICQKPFCGSLEVAEKVTRDAVKNNRTIVVHENFRFQPWYRKINELLQDQLLGEVQQATFRLRPGDGQGPEAYLERQPYFQQMPHFLIHETGIHFIDVFRFLFGEPDELSADLRQLNPHIAGEDAGIFTFMYNNGLRVVFDGNRHLDHGAANTRHTMGEMLIEGTGGTLQLTGDGDILHRTFGSTQTSNIPFPRSGTGFAADCVYLLQAHVVSHLLDGTTLENNASDYLHNQKLEALVYQANESGRKLPVH